MRKFRIKRIFLNKCLLCFFQFAEILTRTVTEIQTISMATLSESAASFVDDTPESPQTRDPSSADSSHDSPETDTRSEREPSAESMERESKNGDGQKKDDSMFECNICLDTAKEAVVSMCGHLFCWPCLHQWLETRPSRQLCPVCKAAISKEKVIPLYGRGSTKEEDPR